MVKKIIHRADLQWKEGQRNVYTFMLYDCIKLDLKYDYGGI
jgi:hypothetical protein